jgi:hypothetical protein
MNLIRKRYIIFFLLAAAYLAPHLAVAQRITGKVYDENGEALAGATVFLEKTTIGVLCDSTGFFKIDAAPRGQFRLIATMVGFKMLSTPVVIEEKPQHFIFKLKPSPNVAREIEVRSSVALEWRKHLDEFKRAFLGTTPNAEKCTITNPLVLDFRFRKSFDTLVMNATSPKPLIVENRALGYKLTFYFTPEQGFESLDAIAGQTHIFQAPARFEELKPSSDEERFLWRRNRADAYNGSPRNFLKSLVTHSLSKNGFQIRHVTKDEEWPIDMRNITYSTSTEEERVKIAYDSATRKFKVNLPRFLEAMYEGAADKAFFIDKPHFVGLHNGRQNSLLVSETPELVVDSLGNIYTPFENNRPPFFVRGYWAWQRVAEWLPENYSPESL